MKRKELNAMTSEELVSHIIEATKYLQDFAFDEGFDKGCAYEQSGQSNTKPKSMKISDERIKALTKEYRDESHSPSQIRNAIEWGELFRKDPDEYILRLKEYTQGLREGSDRKYTCYLNGGVYGRGDLEFMTELFKNYFTTCEMYEKKEAVFKVVKD